MRFNATHATGVVFVIVWLIPGFQHVQSPHDGVRRFLGLLPGGTRIKRAGYER
jgi:hypothetical protein